MPAEECPALGTVSSTKSLAPVPNIPKSSGHSNLATDGPGKVPEGRVQAQGKPPVRPSPPPAARPPPRTHLPHRILISLLPPGKSREAEAAAAWVTGIKGTLKLNSVAEEEKSKLVPDEEVEAAPPPPLGFLSAMAAAHLPLHVYWGPVRNHQPETGHGRGQHTSALAHKGRNSGRLVSLPLLSPTRLPGTNMAAQASRPAPST